MEEGGKGAGNYGMGDGKEAGQEEEQEEEHLASAGPDASAVELEQAVATEATNGASDVPETPPAIQPASQPPESNTTAAGGAATTAPTGTGTGTTASTGTSTGTDGPSYAEAEAAPADAGTPPASESSPPVVGVPPGVPEVASPPPSEVGYFDDDEILSLEQFKEQALLKIQVDPHLEPGSLDPVSRTTQPARSPLAPHPHTSPRTLHPNPLPLTVRAGLPLSLTSVPISRVASHPPVWGWG